MAERRQPHRRVSVEEVADLVDERFPDIEFDGVEEWSAYVSRCRARREQRRALAVEHGFSLWDLFWVFHNKAYGPTSKRK